MDSNFDPVFVDQDQRECSEGLQLRQHLLKLRWLGLDGEADRLAVEIAKLDCSLPRRLAPHVFPTD